MIARPQEPVQEASALTTIGSSCGRLGTAPSAFTAPQLTSVPVAPATTLPAAASGAGAAGASAASWILITSPRAGGPRSSVGGTSKSEIAIGLPLSAARLVRPTITWAASRSMKKTQVTEVTTTRLEISTPLQDSTSPKMSAPSISTTEGCVPAGTGVPPVDRGAAADAGATAHRSRTRASRGRRIAGGYRTPSPGPLKGVLYGADGSREMNLQTLFKAPRRRLRRGPDRVVHSATTDGRRSAEMRHEITPPRADSGLAQRPAGVAAIGSARRAGEPRKEG